MRVHILSLPHTETTKQWSFCAFTEKNRKLASMLFDSGYDVRLYSGEENEARCTEHVPVIDRAWQKEHFGKYNWATDVFNEFNPDHPAWVDFNARCVEAIRSRMGKGDILAMSMGWSQRPVANAFPDMYLVEAGIGYSGIWAPFRVYESHAWEHYLAAKRETDDARLFDVVIPNSFEAEDFPMGTGNGRLIGSAQEMGEVREPYYLFVGRFIRRKGIQIAVEATQRLGVKLLVAGQGVIEHKGNTFRGIDVEVSGDHIEHVGVVGPVERAKLYGEAIATFTPSLYLEPFCGVSAESQMTGTPVISTDWGALVENVEQGVTGYRCRTLNQFMHAAEDVKSLDRWAIRHRARSLWSTDVVRHQYDAYFRQLATLKRAGWYETDAPLTPNR